MILGLIRYIASKCKSNFYVFVWAFVFTWAYKFPTRILLGQFDLLAYYPLFNVMFVLLGIVVIANLKTHMSDLLPYIKLVFLQLSLWACLKSNVSCEASLYSRSRICSLYPVRLSVKGKATSRYLWLTPQFYYDLLQTLLSRVFNSLEWGLNSPPKPHAFTSLPLQSNIVGSFTSIFCALILSISGCITIYKLYLSQKTMNVSDKTFFKCLFKNLIDHPYLFIFKLVLFIIISFCIRTMVFYYLGMYEIELFTYLIIVFCTILPVLYTYYIVTQVIYFICRPITFAPFLLKNGVVVYVPVFTRINLSIHNKQLLSSINIINITIVLMFAAFGYYFSPIFYPILFYNYLGLSEVEFISSNFTCDSKPELSTSSTPLVNECKQSSTSSTHLPITDKAGSSTSPLNSKNSGTQMEAKQNDKSSLIVDISYVKSEAPITKRPFWAVYDRLDPTCTNLKRLYPGTTTKVVDVPEVGQGVKGLRFRGSDNQWNNSPEATNSTIFKEQAVPDQQNKSSTNIPRAKVDRVDSLGATVLSLGNDIGISSNGRSYLPLRERNN